MKLKKCYAKLFSNKFNMAKYLITFNGKKQAEKNIKQIINNYDSLKIFDNTWFVESNYPAFIIGDKLREYIGENENVFITEISNNRDCWLSLAAGDFLNT